MFKKKLITLFTLFLVLFIVFTPNVYAYNLLGYKWNKSSVLGFASVTYKWGDNLTISGSVIRTGFENAIKDWNSAQNHVVFSHNSNSSNTLNSYYVASTGEYGYCYYEATGSTFTLFEAYVNAGNSNITKTNVARFVANHELGHAIGLNDVSSGIAIMQNSKHPHELSYFIPQTDDKNGVNALYK